MPGSLCFMKHLRGCFETLWRLVSRAPLSSIALCSPKNLRLLCKGTTCRLNYIPFCCSSPGIVRRCCIRHNCVHVIKIPDVGFLSPPQQRLCCEFGNYAAPTSSCTLCSTFAGKYKDTAPLATNVGVVSWLASVHATFCFMLIWAASTHQTLA